MTFTKAMIDLAKEIRRRAPAEIKPTIKMANPELFTELGTIYRQSSDAVMKALIKEICELAGEPWSAVLKDQSEDTRTIVKTYRGQITYEEKPAVVASTPDSRPKRIYRGQVVHG